MQSSAAIVLLDEARAHRDQARRAYATARQLSDEASIDRLESFADECEARAEVLEQSARRLSAHVSKTRALSLEIDSEGERPRSRLMSMPATLRKAHRCGNA